MRSPGPLDGKKITFTNGVCTAQFHACVNSYDPTTQFTNVTAANFPYDGYMVDDFTSFDWSPDSTTLLVEEVPATGTRYLQLLAQTGAPTITIANACAGVYAPSGGKIAFGRTISGVPSVMTANTDGTGQVRIAKGTSPDWQPVQATRGSLVPAGPAPQVPRPTT